MEFDIADGTLRKYKGKSLDVVVPDGVEKISKNAFSGLNIQTVTLPDSVTQLRPRTFANCKELRRVVLPQNLTEIPKETFFACVSLELVELPHSVTVIREKAFYGCNSLVSIRLNEELQEIERAAFMGCGKLHQIDIPDRVERIAENTFRGCVSITSVALPSSLRYIGNSAFSDCGELSELTINTDNYIWVDATSGLDETRWFLENSDDLVMLSDKQLFRYKGKERVLTIPTNVECISTDAFLDNDTLEEMTVPSTVKMVHTDAFAECNALKKVWYAAEKTESSAFRECNALEEIYFADNVTDVGEYCLFYCRSLKYIRLSKNMIDVAISVLPRFASFILELPHRSGNAPNMMTFNYGAIHRVYAPYLTAEDIMTMGNVVLMRAAMGYIDMCINGRELPDEVHISWTKQVERYAASLLKDMDDLTEALDYVCKNRLLNSKQTSICMEMFSGNVEVMARLLEYKQTLGKADDYTLD